MFSTTQLTAYLSCPICMRSGSIYSLQKFKFSTELCLRHANVRSVLLYMYGAFRPASQRMDRSYIRLDWNKLLYN